MAISKDAILGDPVSAYTEGARVYHDANQTIASATNTILAFNSERFDTDTIHDTVTNNSRLTCKTAGKYLIIGSIKWQSTSAGNYRRTQIYLNGATSIAEANIGPENEWQITVSCIYDLAVNDYVEIRVIQDSGVSLTVNSVANSSPEFMIQRIG